LCPNSIWKPIVAGGVHGFPNIVWAVAAHYVGMEN
jgi:hypothetical protein